MIFEPFDTSAGSEIGGKPYEGKVSPVASRVNAGRRGVRFP